MKECKIQAPTNCPSCGSVLEWSNHLLYCKNLDCGSKREKCIQHFAKSLKIKGLGPAAISKLNLANINELYTITVEEIAFALSSERLAGKLFDEIENSKKVSLNLLLPAFSIPLIGKTAADKLSKVCENITDITDKTCKLAGIGPKATDNLLDWLTHEFPLYKDLPFTFKFDKPKSKKLIGVVCITGKLKTCGSKAEAAKLLNDSGYSVKDSLTKDVTILLNESGIESAKTKQARDSGVTIVTNLKDLIGE